MRRVRSLSLGLLFALASITVAEQAAKATLAIEGMTCGGCSLAVKLQLKRTAGVTAYEVSYETKRADVTYDPSLTNPAKIAESVAQTGFQVSVVPTAGDAAPLHRQGQSCDGDCCKRPARAVQDSTAKGLVSLASDVRQLRSDFNAVKARPRFLTILSPTCSACVHGAEAVRAAIVAPSALGDVFVVWAPMLDGDDAAAASAISATLAGPSVRQYWDPQRRVGASFRKELFPDAVARMRRSLPAGHFFAESLMGRDETQPEWDIYLFYAAGSEWAERVPAPARWVRQTARFGQPGAAPRSLLWIDDYGQPPMEGSLAEQLRLAVTSVTGKRASR
ncbi:MAG: heavy-metal-associated domain-containing protein [Vicinamibacteria bacterium]|jgi:copper chaperone CopZ|nr:heavy-metal-associated domain-containing protein [Vicinamibacteria bacterium]